MRVLRDKKRGVTHIQVAKGESLTPYMDAFEEESKMLIPDPSRLPAPSPLDEYFMEVCYKHHGTHPFDYDDGSYP